MNKRAIGYVRVSTTRQAEEGVSIDAQMAHIQAWCADNDYTLAETFTDAGISGSRTDNRPKLQRALNAACKHRAALVVYSLSRLARSTKDAIEIVERLHKAGAELVSLTERQLDTTTAAGKMTFGVLALMTEFERNVTSERTTAALAHKRRNGERTGGIPFGWELAGDEITLVAIDSEQAIIAEMKAMRTAGRSYRSIANELTERGVPTKKGRGGWAHQAVQRIVKRNA